MKKNIKKMSDLEIIQYLKEKRKVFISQTINQEIMEDVCGVIITDEEWGYFTNICDMIEEDGFRGWDYAEVWEYVKDKSIENKNSVF